MKSFPFTSVIFGIQQNDVFLKIPRNLYFLECWRFINSFKGQAHKCLIKKKNKHFKTSRTLNFLKITRRFLTAWSHTSFGIISCLFSTEAGQFQISERGVSLLLKEWPQMTFTQLSSDIESVINSLSFIVSPFLSF